MLDFRSQDLVRYLADFGLSLGDLRPEQTAMFVAARNAAVYVDPLEIPIGYDPSGETGDSPADHQTDRVLDQTIHDASGESPIPADEMDVKLINSSEDLPQIFPIGWLWEEAQPELFYAKLAGRELLMPEWQRPAPGPAEERSQSPEREVVRQASRSFSPRQHAYVLLDTSRTMRDRDRRGTVARGLTLAFLRKGSRQGSTLTVRPFAAEVGPLSSGVGRDDLRSIALKVIEFGNAGQTRIQSALEQAVLDLRSAGPCLGAEIMLVTDGISRLSKNPLGQEKLHTFILGNLFEEKGVSVTLQTLRQWSHSFHRIWKKEFAEVLAPTWGDCQAAAALFEKALADDQGPSASDPDRVRRLLENVKFLLQEFKRSLGKKVAVPAEAQALGQRLDDARQKLRGASPETSAAQLAARGRARFSSHFEGRGRWAVVLGRGAWEYLIALAKSIWRWLRGGTP